MNLYYFCLIIVHFLHNYLVPLYLTTIAQKHDNFRITLLPDFTSNTDKLQIYCISTVYCFAVVDDMLLDTDSINLYVQS